jgi:hypothetical protein
MRPLPTFSKLNDGFGCLGSVLLEGVPSTGDAAERGVDVHAFLQAVNELGAEAALAALPDPDLKAVCSAIPLDELPLDPRRYAAEVKLAWHPVTGEGRELGRGSDRVYPVPSAEWFRGTADLVALVGDDAIYVGDWKTGRRHQVHPSRNRQLRGYALAAARAYGRERAIAEIIRLREDDTPYRMRWEFDLFGLAEIAEEMRELAARIQSIGPNDADVPVRLGPTCTYCPAIGNCREQQALVVRLADNPERTLEHEVAQLLTDEAAPHAFERFAAIKAAVAVMDRAFRARAKVHPIRFADGTVYGEHVVRKKVVDGRVAFEQLLARYDLEVAAAACTMETSQKDIRDALRPVAPKRGLTKAFEQVLDDVKAAGGLTYREEHRIERYTPRAELEDGAGEEAEVVAQ